MFRDRKNSMLWNIIILPVIVVLSVLPFSYAQDKSSAKAETKPSIFGTDKADMPAEKEDKRSKGWYPFVKDKKWYPFIGQSIDREPEEEAEGQEQRKRSEMLPK